MNTASGKNVRSMSLSKRLAMAAGSTNPHAAGNKTIDLSNLHNFQTVEVGGPPQTDLNNTAMVQFNTIMAYNDLLNQSTATGKQSRSKGAQSMPKTTTNKRSKHAKAFSMVQNSYRGGGGNPNGRIQQMPFTGRAPPCTEQYLN